MDIELDSEETAALVRIACARGFKRESPRSGWDSKEERKAVVYAVECVLHERLHPDQIDRGR